jgi:hypothetical protein
MISRSGKCPWRTSLCWPSSVKKSECRSRKSETSASTACAKSFRAPQRKTSVSGSSNAPGSANYDIILGDGVSSFNGKWRHKHPHDTPPHFITPSPSFAHSSSPPCLRRYKQFGSRRDKCPSLNFSSGWKAVIPVGQKLTLVLGRHVALTKTRATAGMVSGVGRQGPRSVCRRSGITDLDTTDPEGRGRRDLVERGFL